MYSVLCVMYIRVYIYIYTYCHIYIYILYYSRLWLGRGGGAGVGRPVTPDSPRGALHACILLYCIIFYIGGISSFYCMCHCITVIYLYYCIVL